MIRRQLPTGSRQPPIVNLPPATKAVAGVMILAYLASLTQTLRPAIMTWLSFDPEAGLARWLSGSLTYGLVHANLMHLVGNLLGVVILGPLIERRHGPWALLLLLLAGSFAGALAHAGVQQLTGTMAGLIGASASAAALIGWSLRQLRDRRGFGQLDRAVLLYGVLFLLFNAVGILIFRDSPIAYAAHAGGFVAGWLLGGAGMLDGLTRPQAGGRRWS